MVDNPVKRRLRDGGSAVGTMVFEMLTSGIGRIVAAAGAEFVIFDQEHTGYSLETMRHAIAWTRSTGVVPIVRVPTATYHLLAGALDTGALGLMVPMVESEAQARLIADAGRYPPVGRRGAAFAVAHDDYADGDPVAKMRRANEAVLLIAQIETAAGVEACEAIAAVDGIDVLWIGHFDLTNSLGIPAQFDHPAYQAAVDRVVAAANRHGKAMGFMASTPTDAAWAVGKGFRCLAYSGDIWLYRNALRDGVATVRGLFDTASQTPL